MYKSFHIFANAALGQGLSGSDRIFIEFAKRLKEKYRITIHVWREGYEMCRKQGLSDGVVFKLIKVDRWCKFGFLVCYFARIFKAVLYALFVKLNKPEETIIYSASEFWMDSLPTLIIKLRYPKAVWIAGWFQTAPNPFKGFSEGSREDAYKLSAFYYWLMQFPIKPFIERWADLCLVNNDLEKKQFPKLDKKNQVIVILGAVNTQEIKNWIHQQSMVIPKVYDGVFQGRFHPQKGIVELIDIWKIVTKTIPSAKLALIGDGPLMKDVKIRIEQLDLQRNVELFGYVFDGSKKYQIFSRSKIVVHPAFYDSGGMAAAEAMAFGLPAVGFKLESYKSYYPKGMIKVKIGDMQEFASKIIELISDNKSREIFGLEAQKMILENWSWDKRVRELMNVLNKYKYKYKYK